MERRLAAILVADVVGYSRLMAADEAGTLDRLNALDRRTVQPAIQSHGGRIVKRMGDGYLVEFGSVVAAVDCAIAWQAAMSEPLSMRIGVHVGDVMVQDDDLFGDTVNIAARLEALAEPGGLCVSEDAYRYLRGKTAVRWQDAGVQHLKNIAEPIRVFQSAGSRGSAAATASKGAWRMPRVLLAPFRHVGRNADIEAFASGLTDTLASALAHFEEFESIDPSGGAGPAPANGVIEAGRAAGATYVIDGSVQAAASQCRIVVRLIDVARGERVWSETLDRELADLFELQDEVTAIVASTIGEAVAEEQARANSDKPDHELDPYQRMVRGLQHLHRINPADGRIALGHFKAALAHNPNHYYPELVLLWVYVIERFYGWPPSRADGLAYAKMRVRALLQHHDRSAQTHRLMARILMLEQDPRNALAHAQRAHALNAYNSDIMLTLGLALVAAGQPQAGIGRLELALRINPYAPAFYRSILAMAYYLCGRHADGLDVLKDVAAPTGQSQLLRVAHLSALGRIDECADEIRMLRRTRPDFSVEAALAGWPFEHPGDRQQLVSRLAELGLH